MFKEDTALLPDQQESVVNQLSTNGVGKHELGFKRIVLFGIKYWPSRGGTSRVAENLIFQLIKRYSISIYCYESLMRKQTPGVQVHWFKPLFRGALGAFFYYFISAVKILFGPKIDLIHAHKTDCAIFIPLLRLRFKVIATSHEAPYRRDKWNKIIKIYFHLAERIFIYSANICTCVSEPLTNFYKEKYNRDVKFIPNGVNCNYDSQDYQKELNYLLPNGAKLTDPYVVFSARRLMYTKGCHTMIEALKKINYQGQVYITGELEQSSKYVEMLKRTSGSLRVNFLGFIEPLPILLELIKHAQLFIFPSEVEGMSIMLLEVASIGKPIVASDIPENTQVFNDSQVLFFKNKCVDDLSEKLSFALSNPEIVAKMSQNAKNKVLLENSWQTIANHYDQLYQSLIE